jgi:hypothetical protein
MEDFTDDYSPHAEFSMHYPCFQRMGYERLRTYFSWRTAARRGELLPVSLSYIFLYVYELLSCIGVENPAQVPPLLNAVRKTYAAFPALEDYLPAWLRDFHIYYGLPYAAADFIYSEENSLADWNKISSYDINKSKFFAESPENAALISECFATALHALSALAKTKNIRLKDLFIHTGNQEIPWLPFCRALFHSWLRQPDRVTELGGEIFRCKNNHWTTLHAAPYAHRKDLIGIIIKKTEAAVRQAQNYKKITADPAALYKATTALNALGTTTAEISTTIETAITQLFTEKNRVVVDVNIKNLAKIREESEEITDRLVVEEGREKEKGKTLGALPPIPHKGIHPLDPFFLCFQHV